MDVSSPLKKDMFFGRFGQLFSHQHVVSDRHLCRYHAWAAGCRTCHNWNSRGGYHPLDVGARQTCTQNPSRARKRMVYGQKNINKGLWTVTNVTDCEQNTCIYSHQLAYARKKTCVIHWISISTGEMLLHQQENDMEFGQFTGVLFLEINSNFQLVLLLWIKSYFVAMNMTITLHFPPEKKHGFSITYIIFP